MFKLIKHKKYYSVIFISPWTGNGFVCKLTDVPFKVWSLGLYLFTLTPHRILNIIVKYINKVLPIGYWAMTHNVNRGDVTRIGIAHMYKGSLFYIDVGKNHCNCSNCKSV